MYYATYGIYTQIIGVVILKQLWEPAGVVARIGGLLVTYFGYGGTMLFAISAKPLETTEVICAVSLLTITVSCQLLSAVMEEVLMKIRFLSKGDKKFLKRLSQDLLGTTGMASVICITLLYIHFRAVQLELSSNMVEFPSWASNVMYGTVISMCVQIVLHLVGMVVIGVKETLIFNYNWTQQEQEALIEQDQKLEFHPVAKNKALAKVTRHSLKKMAGLNNVLDLYDAIRGAIMNIASLSLYVCFGCIVYIAVSMDKKEVALHIQK